MLESEAALRRAFILTEERKVRSDNVISWEGVVYEVPLGYAGRWVKAFTVN